jgi:hypothetical protein
MALEVLELENVGPIRRAEVHFGDLTVLVGPQATGKSIFLEFLKLMVDRRSVFHTMRKHGIEWDGRWEEFFELYFGEGMSGLRGPGSHVRWQGKAIDIEEFVRRRGGRASFAQITKIDPNAETCFFIPAQRVLALTRDGWLRAFSDYRPGDPYVVRDFSETLRLLMESGLGDGSSIFPRERRLKSEIRQLVESAVLPGFSLRIEKGPQRRLVLGSKASESALPFMVWSAGQREFVPLLLGLYNVMPSKETKASRHIKWVVIEELEMGLHPKAISVMLLIVLDLICRGYQVCLSTHSPHVLDLIWALRMFREHSASPTRILDLFGAPHTRAMVNVAESALFALTKVFYFDPESRTARDISNLDPGAELPAEAGWGGLAEFSGHVADEVARVVADDE